jgi:acetate kinase
VSNDVRDIEKAMQSGNDRAGLALRIFSHCIRKYIGALSTNLEGRIDAIIFTAGIGEHAAGVRELCCRGLDVMGAVIDPDKNNSVIREGVISTIDSKVKILVVPTDEERMIAIETQKIMERMQ